MKLNGGKCLLLLSDYKHEVMWANIGQSQIWESKRQKLLGVVIDRNMKFDEYILIQCKKVERELCALGRVLYGCSVAEVQIIALIICMNEH